MGSLYTTLVRCVVEKVGTLLLRYESDCSFANISDNELIFMPKSYLKCKVRPLDLEFIWRRLPDCIQRDEELSKYRPCFKHYVLDGDYISRRDCLLCRYENL